MPLLSRQYLKKYIPTQRLNHLIEASTDSLLRKWVYISEGYVFTCAVSIKNDLLRRQAQALRSDAACGWNCVSHLPATCSVRLRHETSCSLRVLATTAEVCESERVRKSLSCGLLFSGTVFTSFFLLPPQFSLHLGFLFGSSFA